VIFNFVPAAEKHIFLIIAFLINTPSTAIDKWRRIGTEVRNPSLKDSVKFGFFLRLDEVSAYS
jgi:hypothetical protein